MTSKASNRDPFAAGADMKALYAQKEVNVAPPPVFGRPEIDPTDFSLASTDFNTLCKLAPLGKMPLLDLVAAGEADISIFPTSRTGETIPVATLCDLSSNVLDAPWTTDEDREEAYQDYIDRAARGGRTVTHAAAERNARVSGPAPFLEIGRPARNATGEDADKKWIELRAQVVIAARLRDPKAEREAAAARRVDAKPAGGETDATPSAPASGKAVRTRAPAE